jgi:hypothetical protein
MKLISQTIFNYVQFANITNFLGIDFFKHSQPADNPSVPENLNGRLGNMQTKKQHMLNVKTRIILDSY